MNKKKIISLLLSSLMIIGSANSVFALTKENMEEKIMTKVSIENKKGEVIALNKEEIKNVKISEEKAKEISKKAAKEYFNIDITKDYNVNVYLNEWSNKYTWSISWNLNKFDENMRIRVSIDGNTGDIEDIYYNDYSNESESSISKFTYDEAKKISDGFLKRVDKEGYKQCEIENKDWTMSSPNSVNYNFNYMRKVNGINFRGNGIHIEVDGSTGKVVSYSKNWTKDKEIPSTDNIIDQEKAREIFNEDFELKLKYKRFINKYEFQDTENKKNVKLVYDIDFKNGNDIDAKEGKLIERNKDTNYKEEKINLNDKERVEFYKNYKELKGKSTLIKKEEVIDIAEKFIKDNYDGEFELGDISYSSDELYNENNWYVNYEKICKEEKGEIKEGEIEERIHFTIDGKTGQILSHYYNKYNNYYEEKEEFKPTIAWKEGYKQALEYIAKYYPDKVKNLELEQKHRVWINEDEKEEYPNRNYRYTFTRKENGIPYTENSISANINAETGKLESMWCNWEDDVEFTDPQKALKIDDLREIFNDKYKPELAYKLLSLSNEENDEEIKLIYHLIGNKSYYSFNDFDAFTGKMLDYSGEEFNDDIEKFKKEIEKSKYKREIEMLAYNGLVDTKDFKLNRELTNRELIKYMVDALGHRRYVIEEKNESKSDDLDNSKESSAEYGLNNEDYLKMAKYYGFLDESITEKDLDKKISREEMAKAFIKFLSYDIIAQHNDVFKIDVQDEKNISNDNIGYVALAKALEILEVKNNKIMPKQTADIEEMCIALYKALLNKSQRINFFRY